MSEGPDEHSLFARKFNIPSIKSGDLTRWNKKWEKALHNLSASDVFRLLSQMWNRGRLAPSELSELAQKLEDKVCEIQGMLTKFWTSMEKEGQFVTAWLILGDGERRRYLLKGLEEACEHATRGQDLRALCPEISVKIMTRQQGKAFTGFISDYCKGKKGVGRTNMYFLPSEWWNGAVDVSETLPDDIEFAFRLLTIQRNEFISRFLLHTTSSVAREMSRSSPGMVPVNEIMESDPWFATIMSRTLSDRRDKPLIRCENCAKSSESEKNVKFMMCSSCKTKLNFAVHYCSRACQKKDWPNHKEHCGRERILKNIEGTVLDPVWEQPNFPDDLRHSIPKHDANGNFTKNVVINSLGFGTPHPSRPHSPALQRQLSLLTADKDAEYFLFDDMDRPVRVAFTDMWTRMAFRNLRSGAMFTAAQTGVEAMGEYLIKVMGRAPGLSRATILNQFGKEYGRHIPAKISQFEKVAVQKGYEHGVTCMEVITKNLAATIPKVTDMHKT